MDAMNRHYFIHCFFSIKNAIDKLQMSDTEISAMADKFEPLLGPVGSEPIHARDALAEFALAESSVARALIGVDLPGMRDYSGEDAQRNDLVSCLSELDFAINKLRLPDDQFAAFLGTWYVAGTPKDARIECADIVRKQLSRILAILGMDK